MENAASRWYDIPFAVPNLRTVPPHRTPEEQKRFEAGCRNFYIMLGIFEKGG